MRVLSFLFGIVVCVRNWLYDIGAIPSREGVLPTIVVGNVTVGGNGKSPVVEEMCRFLISEGRRPVVLLRGYRGRICGPHLVESWDTPGDVGDEACMHRKLLPGVPIVVARERLRGVEFIKENGFGEIVVLDDGLQHRSLRPTVSFALFDEMALEDVRVGELLPAGRLREPLKGALRRVDAVLLIERGRAFEPPDWVGVEKFSIPFVINEGRVFGADDRVPLSELNGVRALAISSVAKPEQFERMVSELGIGVVDTIRGSDHEPWSAEVIGRIEASPADIFVTTEKDAVKLEKFPSPRSKRGVVLRLSVEFPEKLKDFLRRRVLS